jgi:beta-lactamase regulating signal transducer with metallopeptidase domain
MVVVDAGMTVAGASRAAEPAAASASSWRTWFAAQVQPALPWVVFVWGLGVVVFALRLGGGAWRVRRVRRSSRAAPPEWQNQIRALADRMGVEASVALRQSGRVDGPVLAGWWRPVILVPAGFLSGLPPAQVEALLLHELAHVRRHDVLVGRLQAVVETLLFFHPATWWISKQVRQAREACCDDLVVQAGSGRATYAQALTVLAERAVEGRTTAWAPAATDGSLLDRIQRLVVPPEAPSTAGRRLSIVAAALLMVTVPVGLAACASQQSTTDAESPGAPVQAAQDKKESAGAPEAPEAPSAPDEQETVVVIRDDSTERTIRFGAKGPVEVDSLEEDVYVFRYGDRVDTVDVPGLDGLRGIPHPPFNPDSLERTFRPPFDPDSLERVMEARFNPDSLEHALLSRINPDSIERAVRLRFDRDSLEQHVRRMEHRADSIAQRFAERWQTRDFPDSTFVFRFDGFNPDDFDREDFEFDLDVDSLIRRQKEHADSLRRHFEQMRERMEENRSESLREQARRLRERAERLEERAEEMDDRREGAENGSSN